MTRVEPRCWQWESRDLGDTTKQISKVLGEESVRGLMEESEAILRFTTWQL